MLRNTSSMAEGFWEWAGKLQMPKLTEHNKPFCRSQRPDARLSSTCPVFSNCGWEMLCTPHQNVTSFPLGDMMCKVRQCSVPLVPHSRKKVKPIRGSTAVSVKFSWPSIKTSPGDPNWMKESVINTRHVRRPAATRHAPAYKSFLAQVGMSR